MFGPSPIYLNPLYTVLLLVEYAASREDHLAVSGCIGDERPPTGRAKTSCAAKAMCARNDLSVCEFPRIKISNIPREFFINGHL